MRKNVVAFVAGVVFALGLGLSGMTQPARVIGFLDVFGAWDPTLAFVMGGAMLVYIAMYRLAMGRRAALLGGALQIPTRRDIDARLVGGALLFGAGWGLSGFCPGPALTSLASGEARVGIFVAAMSAGMLGYRGVEALRARARDAGGEAAGRAVS